LRAPMLLPIRALALHNAGQRINVSKRIKKPSGHLGSELKPLSLSRIAIW
jgi:hypothetical protein